MLSQPVHRLDPFPFFSFDEAFSREQCGTLDALFLLDGAWQSHDGEFYRCSMRDVSQSLAPSFQNEVLSRMRELTGLPLNDRVMITAQTMSRGQAIGVHSDRPLLGFEIARLIVQLNKGWQAHHGGVLDLYRQPGDGVVKSIDPAYNTALGFVLHPESYHGVTEVSQMRHTVVFNFWHVANTPELAAYIKMLFAGMDFSDFPAALNPVASAVESSVPEEVSFRAGAAAIALQRWGYEESVIVKGYQHSAGLVLASAEDAEVLAAVLLADWVAGLYRESFDLALWQALEYRLAASPVFSRLESVWRLCLPQQA